MGFIFQCIVVKNVSVECYVALSFHNWLSSTPRELAVQESSPSATLFGMLRRRGEGGGAFRRKFSSLCQHSARSDVLSCSNSELIK